MTDVIDRPVMPLDRRLAICNLQASACRDGNSKGIMTLSTLRRSTRLLVAPSGTSAALQELVENAERDLPWKVVFLRLTFGVTIGRAQMP